MHMGVAASIDASEPACADDTVLWLRSHSDQADERRERRRALTRRVVATFGAGALFAVATGDTAFAPSAQAHTTDSPTATSEPLEAQLPPVGLPAPVVLDTAAVEVRNAKNAGTVPAAIQIIEKDLRRFIDERLTEGPQARDPNDTLQFGAMKVQRWVVESVMKAAEVTGADPVYMMALADKESSFDHDIRAKTSSAEGLFQFIASTWLEVVRTYGAKHGLAAEAAAVEKGKGGQLKVADDAARERIMGLRRDPYIAALMAAEMSNRDRKRIEAEIGRDLTTAECYLAHFLGAGSAGKLMKLAGDEPKKSASKVFPAAAKANKAIFYAKDGKKTRHLTVAEVKSKIDTMMGSRLDRYEQVSDLAARSGAR